MRKTIGPLLLVGVLVIIGGLFVAKQVLGGSTHSSQPPVMVQGLIGSEKSGFLNDPQVQKVLKDKYNLTVSFATAGSISIASGADKGQDFLWPASQYAKEIYLQTHHSILKDEVLFNSPIVIYAWRPITQALVRQGIVSRLGQAYYVVNMPKLISLVSSKRTWPSIGVRALTGPVLVQTTDPTQSNSGFMFAGLMANVLNGDQVVNASTLSRVMPKVKALFDSLGFEQGSTGDLFNSAIAQGEGAYPLWVGYENLYIEESIAHPELRRQLNHQINILYPRPTEWSAHDYMALDQKGVRLLHALEDPTIQQLAWSRHGFRSGLLGVQNNPSVLKVAGVPASIVQTIPLPRASVMTLLIHRLAH